MEAYVILLDSFEGWTSLDAYESQALILSFQPER